MIVCVEFPKQTFFYHRKYLQEKQSHAKCSFNLICAWDKWGREVKENHMPHFLENRIFLIKITCWQGIHLSFYITESNLRLVVVLKEVVIRILKIRKSYITLGYNCPAISSSTNQQFVWVIKPKAWQIKLKIMEVLSEYMWIITWIYSFSQQRYTFIFVPQLRATKTSWKMFSDKNVVWILDIGMDSLWQ